MRRFSNQHRLALGISLIALTVALPAAFGLDLITNPLAQEQIAEPTASPSPDVPSAQPSPEASPTDSPSPQPSDQASSEALPEPSVQPSAEPSAEPSAQPSAQPSVKPTAEPTPIPVHALANQSIYLITPKVVSVDPRAKNAILPSITAGSSETLLLCASSNKAIMNISYIPYIPVAINPKKPELGSRNSFQISGQGSTQLRISGPSYAVMSAFNGGSGMRITSANGSISGSQINLQFVNMSEPTLADHFCGAGAVGNNRSISIRALGIDLQMVKTDVNLKRNR